MSIINTDNLKNILSKFKEKSYLDINQLTNSNLLINGDFQVWQRGETFENKQGYSADRWYYVCYDDSELGKATKDSESGINITNFNTSQNYILQMIETDISKKLRNKEITLSVDIKVENMTQGSIFLQLLFSTGTDTIDWNNTENSDININKEDVSSEYIRYKITATVPDNTNTIGISIGSHKQMGKGMANNDCIVNINNVKLELGSKVTSYVPRNLGEEKMLCQRYYIGGEIIGYAYFITTNAIRFSFPVPTTMRIKPTLVSTTSGLILYKNDGSYDDVYGYELTNINIKQNSITMGFTKENHGLTGMPELVILPIINGLDSELY